MTVECFKPIIKTLFTLTQIKTLIYLFVSSTFRFILSRSVTWTRARSIIRMSRRNRRVSGVPTTCNRVKRITHRYSGLRSPITEDQGHFDLLDKFLYCTER